MLCSTFFEEILFLLVLRENIAQGGGICVANHTSPIDAILLSCDRNYALVRNISFITSLEETCFYSVIISWLNKLLCWF